MATSLDEKIPWSKFSEVTHLEGTALEDVEALDTHLRKKKIVQPQYYTLLT